MMLSMGTQAADFALPLSKRAAAESITGYLTPRTRYRRRWLAFERRSATLLRTLQANRACSELSFRRGIVLVECREECFCGPKSECSKAAAAGTAARSARTASARSACQAVARSSGRPYL